ncbi:hypothetical protein LINPERHAP1_LOCUS26791, partial [Linum perenne]
FHTAPSFSIATPLYLHLFLSQHLCISLSPQLGKIEQNGNPGLSIDKATLLQTRFTCNSPNSYNSKFNWWEDQVVLKVGSRN